MSNTINYVVSGTKPNLSVTATDVNNTQVTVNFSTSDSAIATFLAIRNAFITAYTNANLAFTCVLTSNPDGSKTCNCTDNNGNTITAKQYVNQSISTLKQNCISAFVDFYGCADDNAFYSQIAMY